MRRFLQSLSSFALLLALLPSSLVPTAQAATTELRATVTGTALAVAVQGNYAYVADASLGLRVIDVSEPASPVARGSVNSWWDNSSSWPAAQGVAVNGSYAYVAAGENGLRVVDVSDPDNPVAVGTCPGIGIVRDLSAVGSLVYAVDGAAYLRVIDATNPNSPSSTGQIVPGGIPWRVHVQGDYAYVASLSGGLKIVDVSDPTSMTVAGSLAPPSADITRGIGVSGSSAFTLEQIGGFRAIDASSPSNPVALGPPQSTGVAGNNGNVVVAGGYAYVAGSSGLSVFDVSIPSAVSLAGSYTAPADGSVHGGRRGVAVAGNIVYFAASSAGLLVIEFTPSPTTNSAPTINTLTGPAGPLPLGTAAAFSATFSDPDAGDAHIARWDWGDDTPHTVVNSAASPLNASHTYAAPGVYTVTLTVTDAASESDSQTFEYVVVYDPSAGFVTGGGWFISPPGGYSDAPGLTGKATFGFVSKYQKGAATPKGTTEFQLEFAGFSFYSETYQWLVLNKTAANAQFKGTGTVNGQNEPTTGQSYKFLLRATDGSPDKFRIKIWWEDADATEHVVYDNGTDQAIGGGSIVMHAK